MDLFFAPARCFFAAFSRVSNQPPLRPRTGQISIDGRPPFPIRDPPQLNTFWTNLVLLFDFNMDPPPNLHCHFRRAANLRFSNLVFDPEAYLWRTRASSNLSSCFVGHWRNVFTFVFLKFFFFFPPFDGFTSSSEKVGCLFRAGFSINRGPPFAHVNLQIFFPACVLHGFCFGSFPALETPPPLSPTTSRDYPAQNILKRTLFFLDVRVEETLSISPGFDGCRFDKPFFSFLKTSSGSTPFGPLFLTPPPLCVFRFLGDFSEAPTAPLYWI